MPFLLALVLMTPPARAPAPLHVAFEFSHLTDEASFTARGHKRTEPGQESPLIVSGKVAPANGALAEYEVHVFPSEERIFPLGPRLLFRLNEWSYGESMNVTYFGQAPAELEND